MKHRDTPTALQRLAKEDAQEVQVVGLLAIKLQVSQEGEKTQGTWALQLKEGREKTRTSKEGQEAKKCEQ